MDSDTHLIIYSIKHSPLYNESYCKFLHGENFEIRLRRNA